MVFSSYAFLFLFLPATLLAVWAGRKVGGLRGACGALLLASFVYYGFSGTEGAGAAECLLMISLSIVFNFLMGRFLTNGAAAGRQGASWLAGIGAGLLGLGLAAKMAALPTLGVSTTLLQVVGTATLGLSMAMAGLSLWQNAPAARKAGLVLGLSANLGMLGYYKYAGFLALNFNAMTGAGLPVPHIVLLTGISFYTFQKIAYLVDAYQGKTHDHGFFEWALFVLFFPQLIAGPIVHHGELLPQWSNPKSLRFQSRHVFVGITFLVMGLFKKVVLADTLSPIANSAFGAVENGGQVPAADAWLGVLAYTLQLYFDFSGYSDMALGLARLMGIRMPENFASPYKAVSIVDFWRRWHMTLSRFLRDYVYIGLGGNRHGKLRRYLNLFLTMLLGGLWHGASWNFVIWGALHGMYLCVNHAWGALKEKLRLPKKSGPLGTFAARALTFLAVVAAWVFFKAETTRGALAIFKCLAGSGGWVGELTRETRKDLVNHGLLVVGLLLFVFLLPNSQQMLRRHRPTLGLRPPAPANRWQAALTWRPEPLHAATLAAGFLAVVLLLSRASEFIYYRF